ncbi:MAG TPA: class I SAM-dependent methyltransferase [Stellaceae bacterium]|jgi:SAM-dependent methyltransferase|nr:class I SAM-dependent methyltransferase [Stellaceae bacterium]
MSLRKAETRWAATEPRQRLAFGVDPSRPHAYSLRQSRYEAVADDISRWAGEAAAAGRKLSLLDVGSAWGVLLCHLEAKPHCGAVAISAADVVDTAAFIRERYERFVLGDLTQGYPEIASEAFDVVVCEQVLEHLEDLDRALATLDRVLKPGGKLVLGVPVFLPPLHLIRKHVLPPLFRLLPVRDLGTHHQAFSLYSFLAEVRHRLPHLELAQVRGFRIISGGLLAPLENYRWWWRLNRRLGEWIPAACIEIQAIFEKP